MSLFYFTKISIDNRKDRQDVSGISQNVQNFLSFSIMIIDSRGKSELNELFLSV